MGFLASLIGAEVDIEEIINLTIKDVSRFFPKMSKSEKNILAVSLCSVIANLCKKKVISKDDADKFTKIIEKWITMNEDIESHK